MEWIETTGATLDEAKDRALDRLGVAEDEMEIEVLAEGARSIFGFRKTEARLRARVRPASPRSKMERRDRDRRNGKKGRSRNEQNRRSQDRGNRNAQKRTANTKEDNPNRREQASRDDGDLRESSGATGVTRGESNRGSRGRNRGSQDSGSANAGSETKGKSVEAKALPTNKSSGRGSRKKGSATKPVQENDRSSGRERAEVAVMDLQTQARITEEFVQGLLDQMGLEARVASTIDEDRLTVEAQGLNLGRAIGQRGETVRAITELARTLVQRSSDGQAEGSLTVDIGGYRARRRTFLADFARTQAEAVLDDGRPRALEPMAAVDRKVVHDTVAEIEGVSTISEGSDNDRRVVISLTAD